MSWVSELHTTLPVLVPEARGWGEAAAVPAVLLVLAVAAVRREAQVGGCGQVLCAAVHLEGRGSEVFRLFVFSYFQSFLPYPSAFVASHFKGPLTCYFMDALI